MSWIRKLFGQSAARAAPSADEAPSLPAGLVLVDVRSESEFDSGHLEGALSLPLDRIQARIEREIPDRTTPLLLYCRSGARSGQACAILAQKGYTHASNGGGIGSLAMRLNRTITPRN